jgi:hypothetical protein
MATRTVTQEKASADAFLNFSVTDKAGAVHHFKMGIPLMNTRALDSAVIANPEAIATALKEGRVTARLHVMGAQQATVTL